MPTSKLIKLNHNADIQLVNQIYYNTVLSEIHILLSDPKRRTNEIKIVAYNSATDKFKGKSQTSTDDVIDSVAVLCDNCQKNGSEFETIINCRDIRDHYDIATNSIKFTGEPHIRMSNSVILCQECHNKLSEVASTVFTTNREKILAHKI